MGLITLADLPPTAQPATEPSDDDSANGDDRAGDDEAADQDDQPFSVGDDESAALRAAGSVRVWTAVVERGRYLARRGLRGALHGRLGPVAGERYSWLIDESRGAGSLAVRLALPAGVTLAEGERVVAFGAWYVDAERHWYWQAERVAKLPAKEWSLAAEMRAAPGHVIVDIPARPKEALPVSEITHLGGVITFQVVRAARAPEDGWEIADQSKWRPVGRLHLPGEQPSYGGQDLRAPEEHWTLERGTTYVVRIRRFLPAKAGELPKMVALDAPRRIIGTKKD